MGVFKRLRSFHYNYSLVKNTHIPAFAIALLLVLPGFVWIILDRGIWRGDPVGYALGSISLYNKMIADQSLWLRYLFGGYKGPFILWIGQFFVAIGSLIGSIDFSLLLIPLTSSFISLVLLFKSFESLFKSKVIAFCGCLMVASSPLFNGLSTGFWVEPIQVAITSWFIYAMVKSNSWNFYTALSQFIIALSLAMLIKVSSPLYIIGPAFAFWVMIFKGNPSMKMSRRNFLFLTLSILFFLPTAVFYLHNLRAVLTFAHFASTSPLFASKIPKVDLWIEYLSNGLFLEVTYPLAILLLLLGITKTIQLNAYRNFYSIYSVALFQIIIFFLAWISSSNGDSRYFLSSLPYFVVLACWGLATIKSRLITAISLIIFLVQFVLVSGFTFGLFHLKPSYMTIRPIIRETERGMNVMHDLMPLAKRDSAIVFDLNPELGVAEFQYELAKQNLSGNWDKSNIDISSFFNYTRQEIDTGKINIELVWKNLLAYNTDFYITWNSRLSPQLAEMEMGRIDVYNAVTVKARWAIAAKMKDCSLYEVVTLPSYPELLIYKRCSIPLPCGLKVVH